MKKIGLAVIVLLGLLLALSLRMAVGHSQKTIVKKQDTSIVEQPVMRKSLDVSIPVALYHYVEVIKDKGDTIRQSLDIQPKTFRAQLITLKDAGYKFLTIGEAFGLLDRGELLSDKFIILTFDDGYRDFYTDVFPILKELNVKVTAYVISRFLGYKNYMTEAQVKEIAQSGLVEIGAHTEHHVNLKTVPEKQVREEIIVSKSDLETLIEQPVVSFAYPYGAYNERAIKIVKEAGFRSAVTAVRSNNKPQDRWTVGRFRPGASTGKSLLQIISQQTAKVAVSPL